VKIIGVIPARYGSTRFPGKPLAKINGKPMIQHVYENARKSKKLNRLIVATDDKRIYDSVLSFWGEAVMTSPKHKSGTDRIGEVAKLKDVSNANIIVNIQGDEPFIDHRNIDKAIEPLIKDKRINVSTLCCKINDIKEIEDPNVVKVVFDKDKFAVKFSRKIPVNSNKHKAAYYKHIGLYVYRKEYLLKFIKLKPTKGELSEKLEQLRILENGEKIKVVVTKIDSHSIDTKQDLANLKKSKT
jgi:3-deoxy-manno-octulosonate cytidylyltransferase (CMP-KDO synthetase)